MKSQRIITALIFSLFLLYGCKKESNNSVALNSVALFSINKSFEEVGEIVSFSNLSENSTEYIWDFGDGVTSSLNNPSHVYEEPGIYTVKLTALGNGKSDLTTEIINIVLDFYDIEPGVRVGEFYLKDNLATHFAKLDESEMDYYYYDFSTATTHLFYFNYAGILFVVDNSTENYTLDDIPTITVYPPFEAKTIGEITFGSSFDDVISEFGSPNYITSYGISGTYRYDGINFEPNSDTLVGRIVIY